MFIFSICWWIIPSFIIQAISDILNTKFSSSNKNIYLISLPYSHYCAKARWCLQKSNIKFIEEGHAPFWNLITLYYSSNGSSSVPQLILPKKYKTVMLYNSNEISLFCNLNNPKLCLFGNKSQFNEIRNFELDLDKNFGKQCFRLAYYYLYKNSINSKLLMDVQAKGVCSKIQSWTKFLWGDAMKVNVWKFEQKFDDPQRLLYYRKCVDDTFNKINKILSDGRKYLFKTSNISIADISFICLAVPLILPTEWSKKYFIEYENKYLSKEYKQEIKKRRTTKAGKYVLRLWKEKNNIFMKEN